ncbi:MAG: 30S ribosomal protein S4e [Candidatus Njordarchaeales archaeon]
MTKHGQRKQLKRIVAPPIFPIPRKIIGKFVIKPTPGPHPRSRSIPLGVIVRDVLKYARTLKEVKHILNEGAIKIDGRTIRNYRFPVGMMDVIEIPKLDERYRVIPYARSFILHKINKEEAKYKIVRVKTKRLASKGKFQIGLEDGRSFLLDTEKDGDLISKIRVGDSLMITVPKQSIVRHFPLQENMHAMITAGHHMGRHGKIIKIHKIFGPKASTVHIVTTKEEEIVTALDYVLVIGEEGPSISLPEQ